MTTLKDHQQAMVDLLASGSGIPASASRLAHAMHDVLGIVMGRVIEDHMQQSRDFAERLANDATTLGLNDKALAADVEECRPKTRSEYLADRRVKELENTVKQLRASNAKLREERDNNYAMWRNEIKQLPEQAGCRKDDTQVCEHDWRLVAWCSDLQQCRKCGATKQ